MYCADLSGFARRFAFNEYAFDGKQDFCEILCSLLALPVALQLADQLDPTDRLGEARYNYDFIGRRNFELN
jgi:hypothetical protein